MGLRDLIKDAGDKLLSSLKAAGREQVAKHPSMRPSGVGVPDAAALNQNAGAAIAHYVLAQGLNAENLRVSYDGATHTAAVSGHVADPATRDKIVAAVSKVAHVERVDDHLSVGGATGMRFHTVVAGDTLWKIAEKYYGNGARSEVIFEANRPMLKSRDLIYPGQVLRIPVQS